MIASVRDIAPSTVDLRIAVADWPGHRPGQYADLWLPREGGPESARSYSIVNMQPEAGTAIIRFIVKRRGYGTLVEFGVGDEVRLSDPQGERLTWSDRVGDAPVLLVGSGTGIVPLVSFAQAWSCAGGRGELRLMHVVRSRKHRILVDELEELGSRERIAVRTVFTGSHVPGWNAVDPRGRQTRALAWALEGVAPEVECYACGSRDFVSLVVGMLCDRGHGRERIHSEFDLAGPASSPAS